MANDKKKTKKVWWKRWWVWVLVILVVLGGLSMRQRAISKKEAVDSTEIRKGLVMEELVLSGKIRATEHANLNFQGSGELSWIGVKEGDWVKKGQYLARLDSAVSQSQYEQAVADLRKAQATADKVLDDVKDHDDDETMTQKDSRTTAEASRDRAYRALEIARENLVNGYIKAPFAGLVTNVVFPYTGISTIYTQSQIEILNPETMYLEVLADQTEIKDLKIGQKVNIWLDAYPEEQMEGVILSMGLTPQSGEAGIVYEVKVEFSNLDIERLRVGMTGDARFVLHEKDDTLYIPVEFLNSDTGGKFLKYNIKNNKKYVEVGLEGEDYVEISGEDISEGDVIYD
jgi:RND family efflux transporter MFP subunit